MFVNGSLVMEVIFGKDVSVGTFVFFAVYHGPHLILQCMFVDARIIWRADSVSVAALFPMHCGWQN
jgi:hypothetical protein